MRCLCYIVKISVQLAPTFDVLVFVAGVQKKTAAVKRQLGRYPRIPFTSYQIAVLEKKFQQLNYVSSEEAENLAYELQISEAKVKIWFQNRRARKRREGCGVIQKWDEKSETKPAEVSEVSSPRLVPVSIPLPVVTLSNNSLQIPYLYMSPSDRSLNMSSCNR